MGELLCVCQTLGVCQMHGHMLYLVCMDSLRSRPIPVHDLCKVILLPPTPLRSHFVP